MISEAVLAFPDGESEQGGRVLPQDGRTMKRMTADEFKAAPRPPDDERETGRPRRECRVCLTLGTRKGRLTRDFGISVGLSPF